MPDDGHMKERALFYLDRRIGLLTPDDAQLDHEQMAAHGVSYAERQRAEVDLEKKRTKDQHELEALQWAREKLMEV